MQPPPARSGGQTGRPARVHPAAPLAPPLPAPSRVFSLDQMCIIAIYLPRETTPFCTHRQAQRRAPAARRRGRRKIMTTRTGKIARLPKPVRDELGRRLQDGQPGKELVNWLNSLPAVQDVLKEQFAAHIIETQKGLRPGTLGRKSLADRRKPRSPRPNPTESDPIQPNPTNLPGGDPPIAGPAAQTQSP